MPDEPAGVGADGSAAETQRVKAVGDIRNSTQQIATTYDDFIARGNILLQTASPAQASAFAPSMPAIQALAARAGENVGQIVRMGNQIVERSEPINSLILTGSLWAQFVRNPVSGQANQARTAAADSLNLWTGPASTAYGEKRVLQQGALTAVGNLAGEISNWLASIAVVNANYAAEIAIIFLELAKTILSGAFALGSIIGFFASLEKAADAAAGALVLIPQVVARHGQAFVQSGQLGVTADNILNNFNGLGRNGTWPDSVRVGPMRAGTQAGAPLGIPR